MNDRLALLYREHWHELCRYVRARFGPGPPEPEEVAQMAFLKLAEMNDPQTIESPRAFLATLARHIVADHSRRRRVRAAHESRAVEEARNSGGDLDDRSPERVFLAGEELLAVRRAIDNMPALRRELFLLQRIEGLSFAALARKTGLSQTTVKYHVAMALADCSAALAEAERVVPEDNESSNVIRLHGKRR